MANVTSNTINTFKSVIDNIVNELNGLYTAISKNIENFEDSESDPFVYSYVNAMESFKSELKDTLDIMADNQQELERMLEQVKKYEQIKPIEF